MSRALQNHIRAPWQADSGLAEGELREGAPDGDPKGAGRDREGRGGTGLAAAAGHDGLGDRSSHGDAASGRGWRHSGGAPSMAEVFGSVRVAPGARGFRRFLAFFGPGYLVAVGYMDPGNWATSLAGGAAFGYQLLTVALLSSLMAMLLQALCARLAIGSGRDLAQACRDAWPRAFSLPLWLLAEVAIIATDLAEVIGTAIGLNLLFGIPLEIGVLLTALDVFLVLWLQSRGFRKVEALIIVLLTVIAGCFAVQIAMADPDWGGVLRGLLPSTRIVTDQTMLYLSLGIIGATVMPHNLYLHSGIVQTRSYGRSLPERRAALSSATWDSTIALSFALCINASILILAAAAFHSAGHHEIAEIDKAHLLLEPLLGSALAPVLFGVALLACGLSSTVTATMAGQIVMEGFLHLRIAPVLRRLLTRAVAIIPAIVAIWWFGAGAAGRLMILSQVVLSFQLPFAIVPLVLFTADRAKMGALVAPRWLTLACAAIATVVIALNLHLLWSVATLGLDAAG